MYGEGTLKSIIEGKERDLRDLNIEESNIRIGIEAYLGDLHSFLSNASRLSHLKKVLACTILEKQKVQYGGRSRI